MVEIGNDILLFKNILDSNLLQKLNLLVDQNYEAIFNRDLREAKFPFEGIRGRIELYKFPELFSDFDYFWNLNIENQMFDHYLKYITDQSVVEGYKQHAKTDWKDVFIQIYNDKNTFELNSNIHCDFSGITFVACIDDRYDGGLLVFPKQNIELRLQKGDLVLFPGSHTHPHGVTKLISGERRVLVGQSMGVKQLHKFGKLI